MLSSSAAIPEQGVAAAAEILAANDARQKRAMGADGFASFLRTQYEVDAVCDKYGVPKEFTARPAGDRRAHSTPPPGAICVYARSLEAGMRLPLRGFFLEALAHFGIAPAQFTPNAWGIMVGFLVLSRYAGVPPSLAVFRHFFKMCSLCSEHKKGWYFFRLRLDSSGLRLTGLPTPNSISKWKHEFFFLSSPEPWQCAVEWGEPSRRSLRNPELTVEENKSVVKLLTAHGGATVDLRNLLPGASSRRRRRLCNSNPAVSAAMITTASPPPPTSSTRIISCSKGMDPSVHDRMNTLLAEKAAAEASASASAKKRTQEEASCACEEEIQHLSVLFNVRWPPAQHFPTTHDGETTDWEAALELPLERAFAARDDAEIRQAANYVLELQEKLVARERDAAALWEQLEVANNEQLEQAKNELDAAALREELEQAKNELASAMRAAEAERENAKSELAAVRAELESTKAELASAKRAVDVEREKARSELAMEEAEVVKTIVELRASLAEADLAAAKQAAESEAARTKAELSAARAEAVRTKAELAEARAEAVNTKAELAAAREEVMKTKAELAAAKRSAEAELVHAKAVLTAAETELVKAKAKLTAVEAARAYAT